MKDFAGSDLSSYFACDRCCGINGVINVLMAPCAAYLTAEAAFGSLTALSDLSDKVACAELLRGYICLSDHQVF